MLLVQVGGVVYIGGGSGKLKPWLELFRGFLAKNALHSGSELGRLWRPLLSVYNSRAPPRRRRHLSHGGVHIGTIYYTADNSTYYSY